MASLEEIRNERIKKLDLLRAAGMNPYPLHSSADTRISEVLSQFSKLSKKKSLRLVGRVTAIRGQGALVFFNFTDGSGILQGMLKKGDTKDEALDLFNETVDVGDFIEVKGKLFSTKRKEKTILVSEWTMLSKSLRPLPDKWHGLQDVEERYRRRYLDTLMSPEVKERFVLRSRIITEIRSALNEAGYLEVETPMLQPLAGGATALPFNTHHNALDADLNLRIAPELYLKELLVGGFEKVYELNRNFRNEGIDVTHNPEFTMLEFYEAYSDADKQMAFVEKILKQVVKKTFKKTSVSFEDGSIDFGKKFASVAYFDLLRRYALITHPETITKEELSLKAKQLAVSVSPSDAPEKIMDNIYKKVCRPKLVQPTFIVDYPVAFSPFAKRKEKSPALIDRFQLVVGGLEMVNAFSELNDPIDQRERYLEQDKKRKGGEAEVSPSDETYLEAMEYGMPPAGGVGIGIDRLVMILTGQKNIREVILFPTLRPKA
ncbi:MAG: lysine--tRNA ligase [Candidatus Paceibacterota bacterium]|jgi:lysyl-tRNA synthetase class 2